jgi:hypothetical protein
MIQSLGQPTSNSPLFSRTPQQEQHQSRLRIKAKALLQKQAQGQFLGNQQKRLIARWQRLQLKAASAEVTP